MGECRDCKFWSRLPSPSELERDRVVWSNARERRRRESLDVSEWSEEWARRYRAGEVEESPVPEVDASEIPLMYGKCGAIMSREGSSEEPAYIEVQDPYEAGELYTLPTFSCALFRKVTERGF